jgi:dephospho-CoA kinase
VVALIGLTGGMGAGKSTALAALERLGAATLSTDAVVHDLYSECQVRNALVGRWGEEVAPGGVVDRAIVARRVFADTQERQWLEALLWPLVGQRIASWVTQVSQRRPTPPAAVVETPLLFEAGMQDAFAATIAVIAEESVRRRRAAARQHVLVEERSQRQLSQQEKARRATYTVLNDGTPEQLQAKLALILRELVG